MSVFLALSVVGMTQLVASVDAFGPFGPKCNTHVDQRSCTSKSSCAWCNSTDTDSTGTPFDELCFSTKSAQKLNKTEWRCSDADAGPSDLLLGAAPPPASYYSLYQQSDAKHCVELDVDSEASKNAPCFQKFWAGTSLFYFNFNLFTTHSPPHHHHTTFISLHNITTTSPPVPIRQLPGRKMP